MFTKKLQLKLASNIKSSERRAELSHILSTYNVKDTSKDYSQLLVPKTFKAAMYSTIHQSETRQGTIFSDDSNVPLWFDVAGECENQLIPTVFTCWKCPDLLPQVVTHQYVIERLILGANLMMKGISGPYDARCKPGTIVGVVDYLKANVILAVGICLVLLPEDRAKDEGVVVKILHRVDDLLYKLNDNEGVSIPKELEMPQHSENAGNSEAEDDLLNENDENDAPETQEEQHQEPVSDTEESESYSQTHPDSVSDLAQTVDSLSLEDVDNFFTRALLQSIKLDNIETPISSSTLISNYILKNVPPPREEINMKKTSWKKTAKYLKAMDKLGYLSVKGKGDDLTIVSLLSTSDPVIQNFVPIKIKHSTAKSADSTEKGSKSLLIRKLYKGKSNSLLIFPEIKNPSGYYEAKELKLYLDHYIRKHELVDPRNKKQVLLDDNLKKLCKSATQETRLARDKLSDAFLRSLVQYHQIVSPDDTDDSKSPIVSGEPPKVQVITETRIGRKVITRLYNFEPFRIHAGRFADELKVKCSGSTTIGTNAQNKTEIMVQGPHGKTVIDLLKDKGVPISNIDFEDKSKKKKKSK